MIHITTKNTMTVLNELHTFHLYCLKSIKEDNARTFPKKVIIYLINNVLYVVLITWFSMFCLLVKSISTFKKV